METAVVVRYVRNLDRPSGKESGSLLPSWCLPASCVRRGVREEAMGAAWRRYLGQQCCPATAFPASVLLRPGAQLRPEGEPHGSQGDGRTDSLCRTVAARFPVAGAVGWKRLQQVR